jgi:hypothetical protein
MFFPKTASNGGKNVATKDEASDQNVFDQATISGEETEVT